MRLYAHGVAAGGATEPRRPLRVTRGATRPPPPMTPAPFTATPPRLVVPVDFSPSAAVAVRYAAALGRHVPRARLHLLHVLDGDESKADAHARLSALSAEAGLDEKSPTVVDTEHEDADAADGIANVAEEIEADAIVTSRTGARGWRLLALGRTTDTLVRTARTPVLILPDEAPPHADIRVVAVGVDLGGSDAALIAAARAFAERYGARNADGTAAGVRVVLVHAIAPLPYPASLGGALRDFDPTLHAAIEADVAALAHTVGAGNDAIHAEAIVEDGPPALTLTRVAERIGADVIVVAPAARGRVERWVLGSVAERVIRAATRPVLVVRRKG